MPAFYSPSAFEREDDEPVELLGRHASGKLIVREIGRFWPGIFLAEIAQVAIQCTVHREAA